MAAADGFDFLLQREISAVYTTIAQLRDIAGPSLSVDEIDVTHKGSANRVREFLAGLRDGGSVSADILYDPNGTTHAQITTDLKAGTISNWRVLFSEAGDYITFPAFVTGFEPTGPMEGAMSAALTLKVSGDWTITA